MDALAKEMTNLARDLKLNPTNVALEAVPWLNADYVRAIIKGIEQAGFELGDAREQAVKLGVKLP